MSRAEHLAPLRVPAFRWFFLGEVVNTAGSSMGFLALAFAVLAITDSATALGLVVAAETVPMVALMLLGGALADRLPRGLVLRGCNLLQGVVQGTIALLVLTDAAQIWHLAVLAALSGAIGAVAYPAFHGMVPVLLPPAERKAAYLLLSQSSGLLRVAGPATAGVLVATVGAGWALGFDALTYLVAAAFLTLLRLPPGERPRRRASVVGDLVEGWSFVRALGWVVPVASCSLVFNALISGSLGVLGPVIADDTIGSGGWGLGRSAQAVGLLGFTLVLTRMTLRRPLRACLLGFSLSALPMVVLGTSVSTVALAGAFLVAGAGSSLIDLSWNLTVQEKVPEEMLSRVQSVDGFFSFVAMPIGQVLVGPLVVLLGTSSVELGSAALCVVVLLAGLSRRAIRDLRLTGTAPSEQPTPAAA